MIHRMKSKVLSLFGIYMVHNKNFPGLDNQLESKFTNTRSLTDSHMHVLAIGEQDFRNISISSDISTSVSS